MDSSGTSDEPIKKCQLNNELKYLFRLNVDSRVCHTYISKAYSVWIANFMNYIVSMI